ncbi:MAG: hypothetical protein AAGB12_16005 [Pseudomonadota bacterium]
MKIYYITVFIALFMSLAAHSENILVVISETSQLKAEKKAIPGKGWIYEGYKMTVFSNSEKATATQYYLGGDELHYCHKMH